MSVCVRALVCRGSYNDPGSYLLINVSYQRGDTQAWTGMTSHLEERHHHLSSSRLASRLCVGKKLLML